MHRLRVKQTSANDRFCQIIYLDTISSTLRDLVLRNNEYDTNTFSHSSRLFDGVRRIPGRLDLQYSRFQMGTQLQGNCLFDLFTEMTSLDLSFVQCQSISNDTQIHLANLIKCKIGKDRTRSGEQLLYLYVRHWKLQHLPDWFTSDRFPRLRGLDLSNSRIRSIDVNDWITLRRISLAFNPIESEQITWRTSTMYESIDLRSTSDNRTWNLTQRLTSLLQHTVNIDYSDNLAEYSSHIKSMPIAMDLIGSRWSLNLSRTNIVSFDMNDLSTSDLVYRLDVSFNHLSELNLDRQSRLVYLQCSNQNLSKLILDSDANHLVDVNCSNNRLTTIENISFMQQKHIRHIDLSNNRFETIVPLLSNLSSRYLRTIHFQANRIRHVPSYVFHRKLIGLYSIDLSDNRIDIIDRYAFQAPNLQILDLTGNPLTNVESNFLVTQSLRLFFITNPNDDLVDSCARSVSNNNNSRLLVTYMTWYEQNGTYMRNLLPYASQTVHWNKCLQSKSQQTGVTWTKTDEHHRIKHLPLYAVMGTISLGIILLMIYLYRKNKMNLLVTLQRYRPLDRHDLIGNTDDNNRRLSENDEIVMNLDEAPFNTAGRI
jgi:Leucine-rich repeat (LRR) protein